MHAHPFHRSLVSGIFALLLALITVSELSGQSTGAATDRVARNRERAAELALEADSLAKRVAEWSKAARMYEQSALLHPKGELEGYASFVNAGNFHYFAGNETAARRMFEAAGRLALEHGEVYNAAVCFLNAALIAQESGEEEKEAENALKAQKLSRSSALTDDQRALLLGRIQTVESPAS